MGDVIPWINELRMLRNVIVFAANDEPKAHHITDNVTISGKSLPMFKEAHLYNKSHDKRLLLELSEYIKYLKLNSNDFNMLLYHNP